MLKPAFVLGLLVLMGQGSFADDKPPEWIEGKVVDPNGQPVANVDVGTFWSANGIKGLEDNKPVNLENSEKLAKFWGNVGQMEFFPWTAKEQMRTGPDGSFRVESNWRRHQVLALSADRSLGGLGIVPKGEEGKPITITLGPLVRVTGKIRGPEMGRKPKWTHVYGMRREAVDRPTDTFRLVSCGSFEADFSMLLPSGQYQLRAYDEDGGRVQPCPDLNLSGSERQVDLGVLLLTKTPDNVRSQIEKSKSAGRWRDLKDFVGQTPPMIYADDAKGIARDWQPGRSPGKWQLIEFWGMGCAPCLGRSLPELMKFQETHVKQADRFEIVTVFIDDDEKIKTVADLDRSLKPIVNHVWGGKSLPFPTLIDPSFRTRESFGLWGLGDVVLINPEGKIVEGDLETLRGIIDKP